MWHAHAKKRQLWCARHHPPPHSTISNCRRSRRLAGCWGGGRRGEKRGWRRGGGGGGGSTSGSRRGDCFTCESRRSFKEDEGAQEETEKFHKRAWSPCPIRKKNSSFDFAAYRELNDNLPTLNAQQIRAATAPAKARSPLSKVKRDRRAFKASLEASISKQRRLQWTAERQQKKITDLKGRNNQLMQDILRERCASNKIIDKAMSNARKLSTEALEMMREANLQVIKDDERIISERNRASMKIREERLFQVR